MNRIALLVALVTGGVLILAPCHAQSVVDSRELAALLPEPPPGWTAEPPGGSTSGAGSEMISMAGRSYVQGEGDEAPSVSVNIFDAAVNKAYREHVMAEWKTKEQTEEGYGKPVAVDGCPGYEQFENASRTGMIRLQVAGRYFVQIEITNQPPAELLTWLKLINLKALAALK